MISVMSQAVQRMAICQKKEVCLQRKLHFRHVNEIIPLQLIQTNSDLLISCELSSTEAIVWIMMRRGIQRGGRRFIRS